MSSGRRMVVRMNPDILLGLGKKDGIRTVGAPVPQDARVVNRMIDERGDLLLLVESEEFTETPEGKLYPTLDAVRFRSPDEAPDEPLMSREEYDALTAKVGELKAWNEASRRARGRESRIVK